MAVKILFMLKNTKIYINMYSGSTVFNTSLHLKYEKQKSVTVGNEFLYIFNRYIK